MRRIGIVVYTTVVGRTRTYPETKAATSRLSSSRMVGEKHYSQRIGWLRAAVLGANDGIVSIASLLVGVAAAEASRNSVLVAGMGGLGARARGVWLPAGEYFPVTPKADTEAADLVRERRELHESPEAELEELRRIFVSRGLDADLAARVAEQLPARDALGAHAREELGLTEVHAARPIQAALASAATFAVGGGLPLLTSAVVPTGRILVFVPVFSLVFLAGLGAVSARAGGSSRSRAALRVTFWGALAMALTALVGRLFGAVV